MTMQKIQNDLRDGLLWLSFGIFVAITFLAVYYHQAWRDEAQSWLFVRDLGLWEVIRRMPYEGAQTLWYLLVMPLAKMGLPYAAQGWLHYALALVAIFLLLFTLPVPYVIRVFLPFSYYFLFEYSVVARNYILTVLLLFAIAAVYETRLKRPLVYGAFIMLLSWTNIHSLAAACALAALFVYDLIQGRVWTWRHGWACAIMALGILSECVLFKPFPGQVLLGVQYYGWQGVVTAASSAIWPDLAKENRYFAWLAVAWIPLAWILIRTWKARLFLIVAWGWLGGLFWIKDAYLRHYGLILVFFIFAWCLDSVMGGEETGKSKSLRRIAVWVFFLLVLANIEYAVMFFSNHRGKNFSGAREMAAYIQQTGLVDQELASYPADLGKSVLPYLPGKRMYRMEDGKMGTFNTWTNKAYFEGPMTPFPTVFNSMIDYYMTQSRKPDSILFLCPRYIVAAIAHMQPLLDCSKWELLFHNTRPSIKSEEYFYLYRIPLPKPVDYYQRLFEAQPDSVARLNNLAWQVATAKPDGLRYAHLDGWPAAAVTWAERALELSGKKVAGVWDTVAAARANVGDFDGAVTAAEQALNLAAESGDQALALRLQAHLNGYRAGTPWRE